MVTYPSDWTESKLLDHVNLVQGLTYTPENVKPHGTLVLRSSNIQEGHLALEDNVYVDSRIPEEKMIQEGDILVCVRNGSSALIGKSCVLPAMSNTTFGAFMSVLRGDTTGYIAKVFESDIVQEQVRGRSNATINQITKKDFKSIAVTMPDGPEQKAIAGVLSSFDSYISDLSELIEKKKAIRDGALEDLMSGRTRLAGFHKEWVPIPFEEYFTLIKNNTYSREQLSEYGSVGNIHYGDILVKFGNIVSDKDEVPRLKDGVVYSEKWLLQEKDVLIADTAEDETVGKAIQIGTMSYPVVGGLHTIVCRPNVQTATGFLGFYINSKSFHDQLLPHITGIKVSSVSKKSIKTTELLIPSDVEEQEAITDVLVSMDDEIKNLEGERNKMIQIREGAMDDLLTGRVRLPI